MRKKLQSPVCLNCGNTFRPKSRVSLSKVKYCSVKCYGEDKSKNEENNIHLKKISSNGKGIKNSKKGLKGSNNPMWKGGITYLRKGGNYKDGKMILCPEKYKDMSRKNGYVYEHRIIMAEHIGRSLDRLEVVHHIDHNPHNNDINNLMLFPNNKLHKQYESKKIILLNEL